MHNVHHISFFNLTLHHRQNFRPALRPNGSFLTRDHKRLLSLPGQKKKIHITLGKDLFHYFSHWALYIFKKLQSLS